MPPIPAAYPTAFHKNTKYFLTLYSLFCNFTLELNKNGCLTFSLLDSLFDIRTLSLQLGFLYSLKCHLHRKYITVLVKLQKINASHTVITIF